jgi:hypothetical protein
VTARLLLWPKRAGQLEPEATTKRLEESTAVLAEMLRVSALFEGRTITPAVAPDMAPAGTAVAGGPAVP